MIVIRPKEISTKERSYLSEIVVGLWVTLRHLLENMLGFLLRRPKIQTLEYPEQKPPYTGRTRLLHRLTAREDGSPKCVACYMCATACPALAIEIIAEESPDPDVEKRPLSFVIDELRCVFCGFCVEACPKDAIRMDSDVGNLVGTHREDFIYNLRDLMAMPRRPDAYPGDRERDAKEDAGLL